MCVCVCVCVCVKNAVHMQHASSMGYGMLGYIKLALHRAPTLNNIKLALQRIPNINADYRKQCFKYGGPV